ncbi:MAG: arsenosugar biosynthesis radical SAM (seleno)protein ArsS [Myxococcota bacterium]
MTADGSALRSSRPKPSRSKRLPTLRAQNAPLASADAQRALLERYAGGVSFERSLREHGMDGPRATGLRTLQINLGKMCNQTCRHCHVDAGPDRREIMTQETMRACLTLLENAEFDTVDLTGGAPEMNPHFRWFVEECRRMGMRVIDRCNLTILLTPIGRGLPEFLAEHQVELICSLPHVSALNTDRQRGDGVFDRSIVALQRLNKIGYGREGSGLSLVLVTNPAGAFLPGPQSLLEREWKKTLKERFDIEFNTLFTITNMPISRYLDWLVESGNCARYMDVLVQSFNPRAAEGVMCKTMLSVGWDGCLYDCDFNQMLELPIQTTESHVARIDDLDSLSTREIVTGPHCFGCTAGSGSSCGGATA